MKYLLVIIPLVFFTSVIDVPDTTYVFRRENGILTVDTVITHNHPHMEMDSTVQTQQDIIEKLNKILERLEKESIQQKQ